MSTLREAAQQALKALEMLGYPIAVIIALRKALAQQTQTPCDIAEDGVCEVIDCCRNRSQILEALEIGYDSAQAEAAQYHAAMAGYRPERHAEMDADVAKIAAAITAVKAVTAKEEQEPTARFKCTVVDDQHPNGVPFEQWVNAPQQEQKPVAWLKTMYSGTRPMLEVDHLRKDTSTPVYTHPPRREWQGLTDEEAEELEFASVDRKYGHLDVRALSRAIETKLKEKNT